MVQQKVVVDLPGLNCAACVRDIERAIRQEEGVIWATVNFASASVTIIYDSSSVRLASLLAAVRKLGLDARSKGVLPQSTRAAAGAGR